MAKRKTNNTATSGQQNRTAAIVDYVQQHPEAANAEIADAVNAQYGWNINTGYVSTIKSKKGLTRGRRRKSKKTAAAATAKPVGRPKTAAKSDLSLSQLKDAKRLADELGGLDQAKKALDALADLQG